MGIKLNIVRRHKSGYHSVNDAEQYLIYLDILVFLQITIIKTKTISKVP